ncbi:Ubiquitin- ligase E3C [Paramuricea clavata]|uniref:HECT-type E3 ubiquitin transferase n=1 Tax=Paramuricea clavata TaxID=317549 RepID=A0A7D9L2C9_PARCT|nr:Ubiquitin- ligase E3C [Paramuricea clavata]
MFGGEYKSKPKVSLGGKSKKEKRSSLIHRNQTEREKREEHRRQIVSALKIQAFLRGHWIRQREYDVRREDFDAILVKLKASQHPDIVTIHLLLSYLLFFYSNCKDSERLISMCQLLLKNSKNLTVLDHKRWTFQIKQFLCLCSRNLKEAVETKRAFAIPLRTLEVFTSPTWYDHMTEYNREEHATSVSMHLAKHVFREIGESIGFPLPGLSIEHIAGSKISPGRHFFLAHFL